MVHLFFDFRLIQPVHDGVFTLWYEDLLDLLSLVNHISRTPRDPTAMTYFSLVLEGHLTDSHAAILFEVIPWGVYYGDVVLLVA